MNEKGREFQRKARAEPQRVFVLVDDGRVIHAMVRVLAEREGEWVRTDIAKIRGQRCVPLVVIGSDMIQIQLLYPVYSQSDVIKLVAAPASEGRFIPVARAEQHQTRGD